MHNKNSISQFGTKRNDMIKISQREYLFKAFPHIKWVKTEKLAGTVNPLLRVTISFQSSIFAYNLTTEMMIV